MRRRKKKSLFSIILIFILLISSRTSSLSVFAGDGLGESSQPTENVLKLDVVPGAADPENKATIPESAVDTEKSDTTVLSEGQIPKEPTSIKDSSLRFIAGYSMLGVGPIGFAKSTSMLKTSTNSTGYTSPPVGLQLSKTASVFSNTDNGRQTFKVDLKVEAISNIVITKKPADIILVLDNSSSLSGNTDDTKKSARQEALITAATKFVNDVAMYSNDSKIAVVNAKNGATSATPLLSVNLNTGKQIIMNSITGITTSGSSVVEQGLESAFNIYNSVAYDSTRTRIVILVTGSTAGGPVMADSIQWSAILKGSHSATIDPSNILLGNSDGTSGYPISAAGCNATVYSIGLFSSANADTNEYLWRVSNNSPSGAEVTGENYYPNDSNSYYLTTNQISGLDAIFQGISEQLGTTLNNAVVKDYIDTRFNIVDTAGKVLEIGDSITAGGNTGTIKSDSNGIYVEWPRQEIAPKSVDGVPAKIFTGAIYLKPKADFIGGNNIPTNIKDISALYVDNMNIGSFPNPLVNVPFNLTIQNVQDYVLLGEGIPRTQVTAQHDMVTESLNNTSYEYPAEMLSYVWDPGYTSDIKPITTANYNLTVTAAPFKYIENPDPDFYHIAVGDLAAMKTFKGIYTVIPVQPIFTGSTYNIFLGEAAGDGGATTLPNAITLSIPNYDIGGAVIPSDVKAALEGRLTTYKGNITFNVDSAATDEPYTDPLSNYEPTVNTTLNITAKYEDLEVGIGIQVDINVNQGTLTITKLISGTTDPKDSNQTFVFEIKQYSTTNELIKIFYETIRVEGSSSIRKVIKLPKGIYEVTEKSDWSWQYNLKTAKTVRDTLGMNPDGTRNVNKDNAAASFTNESKIIKWLTSIDWVINKFTGGVN